MTNIEYIKSNYLIKDAWRDENCPGQPTSSVSSPFREDLHASFSVFDDGRRWKDFSTEESGDVIDFVCKSRACRTGEAIQIISNRLGCERSTFENAEVSRSLKPKPKAITTSSLKNFKANGTSYQPKEMPADVVSIWGEGVNNLRINVRFQISLDEWRSWPSGTTSELAESGLMGTPILRGKRGLTFVVQYPKKEGLIDLGFHHRFRAKGLIRASWQYQPKGIPSVPFVLGAGYFRTARLVIITEGQYDCIAFCAAAGWLLNDTSWPENVTAFGIRGSTSWKVFIEHWQTVWPEAARFLVFIDNDKAGKKWLSEFATELSQYAESVTVLTPQSDGEDFSDIQRHSSLNSEDIFYLLKKLKLLDSEENNYG